MDLYHYSAERLKYQRQAKSKSDQPTKMKKSTLTGSSSPEELFSWMNKNLDYHGVSKESLFTVEEVIKNKKGHCWETSELEYVELSELGFECVLLYIESENLEVTHTALFFKENDDVAWFEWAWGKHAGIHRKMGSIMDAASEVIGLFEKDNGKSRAYIGYSPISKNMSQTKYLDSVKKWNKVNRDSKKSVYNQWSFG